MTTTIKPFHGSLPRLPDLFHTYCSEHPDFGTCAEEAQAHRDVAEHIEAEHPAMKQEGEGHGA